MPKGYGHQEAAKQEHKDKVSGATPEGPLFQHPAVSVPVARHQGDTPALFLRKYVSQYCTHPVLDRQLFWLDVAHVTGRASSSSQ